MFRVRYAMADLQPPSRSLDDDALDAAFDATRSTGDTGPGSTDDVRAPRASDTASPPPRLPSPASGTDDAPPAAPQGFDVLEEGPPPSLVRRFLTTWRHAIGLVY